MEHETARELTAAYALDALDAPDVDDLEEHLAGCERCRDELAGLRRAAASLAYVVDTPAPPPALRGSILSAARAERPNVVPLLPRRNRTVAASLAAAAVSAAAALAVGLYAAGLSRDLDREREVRGVLADPGARVVSLEGAPGRIVVAPSGEAVLAARMAPAPKSRTYELWIMEGSEPVPAGTFEGAGATDVVRLRGRVRPGSTVAVTIERDGGVDAPTSAPIASATL